MKNKAIKMVKQRSSYRCVTACLAMATGMSYKDAKSYIDSFGYHVRGEGCDMGSLTDAINDMWAHDMGDYRASLHRQNDSEGVCDVADFASGLFIVNAGNHAIVVCDGIAYDPAMTKDGFGGGISARVAPLTATTVTWIEEYISVTTPAGEGR